MEQVMEFLKKKIALLSFTPHCKHSDYEPSVTPKSIRWNSKWEFVKRVNSQLKGQGFFCKLDTTKEHRDQEYELRQQMNQLRSSNNEINYHIQNMNIQQEDGATREWVVMKSVENKNTAVLNSFLLKISQR